MCMALLVLYWLWCMQLRLTLATMCFLSHFQLSVVLLGLSYTGCCQVDTVGAFITMFGMLVRRPG